MLPDRSQPFTGSPPTGAHARAPRGTESVLVAALQQAVADNSIWVSALREQLARVVVGQKHLVDRLLVAVLTGGHVLVEGLPGLAKTLSLKTLAQAVDARFARIQFTPDMLPADIVGTLVYRPHDGSFVTKHGPVFANFVLADEINRASAKVQSALLEAMQERQVTIGEESFALPQPFLVMATQNPVEQEGTYTLPEAQIDRFLMKVVVGYPSAAEERAILDAMATSAPRLDVDRVVSLPELMSARQVVDSIRVDDRLRDYVVALVRATRKPSEIGLELDHLVRYGGSPRATIALTLSAKAWAFLQGRGYVTPQDIKAVAFDVLRHRVALTYDAEAQGIRSEDVLTKILSTLAVP
ncbi:MAG: MoxR family ATPase [Myxococcota bacterium]|nr:MoxR family ATPase [Myxococcota bacterium]